MPRCLDLTSLRSFVAVADTGGVTRSAGLLNLTQSAVSMQLKRLEESLDTQLLDRSARQIALTPAGEQLLSYARRMLELNDEVYCKLTSQDYEGTVTLGVPQDIVYPVMPKVLQALASEFPRLRVNLVSSFTKSLKDSFGRGEIQVMLTTEDSVDPGGEILSTRPLIWVGAPGGVAWKQRPLRLAFEDRCRFRQEAQRQLDRAGIPWNMAVESDSTRTIEATVSADLAVHAMIDGTEATYFEPIPHGGALPDLGSMNVNLYVAETFQGAVATTVIGLIRDAYLRFDRYGALAA